jgi:hypothetical protein
MYIYIYIYIYILVIFLFSTGRDLPWGSSVEAVAAAERDGAWSWPLSPNVEFKNTWRKCPFVAITWRFIRYRNTFDSHYIEDCTYPLQRQDRLKALSSANQPAEAGLTTLMQIKTHKGRFPIRVRCLTPENTFLFRSRQSKPSDFLFTNFSLLRHESKWLEIVLLTVRKRAAALWTPFGTARWLQYTAQWWTSAAEVHTVS